MCLQNGNGFWHCIQPILQARLCELHNCVARKIYQLSLCMRGNAAGLPLYLSRRIVIRVQLFLNEKKQSTSTNVLTVRHP